MDKILASLGASFKGGTGPRLLVGTGSDQVHLVIVATGDRGLCGGFNSTIVREARRQIRAADAEGKTVKIFCVGRKGRDQLRRDFSSHRRDDDRSRPAAPVLRRRPEGRRARHGNVRGRRVRRREGDLQSLQVGDDPDRHRPAADPAADAGSLGRAAAAAGGAIYEFEPDEGEILADLLPRNLTVQIFRILLENAASFYGSQMTAMDNASRNAGDVIKKLTLQMNRSRQASITKELIEIISGAEAV